MARFSFLSYIRPSSSTDKRIGNAESKGRYDLPLTKSTDTRFLVLLIALMSYLGVMALSGVFALTAISHHWSSGLKGQITIEIPAENPDGSLRTEQEIETLKQDTKTILEASAAIESVKVLSAEDISDLLSPWLGDSQQSANAFGDIPLPGLISAVTKPDAKQSLAPLRRQLKELADNIQVDTHKDWLDDILRLTLTMQTAAIFITILIAATTVIAVAGAIKSRIAIYKKDVELLHLMGASDAYIARQFQRHSLILAIKGSIIGVIFGVLTLVLAGFLISTEAEGLLPHFDLNAYHWLTLFLLPAFMGVLGFVTTRYTVLQSLSAMP